MDRIKACAVGCGEAEQLAGAARLRDLPTMDGSQMCDMLAEMQGPAAPGYTGQLLGSVASWPLLFGRNSLQVSRVGSGGTLRATKCLISFSFDSIRQGGPTRPSADASVPRLAGVSLNHLIISFLSSSKL